MVARSDFNLATRQVIASRAGYRCTYPGCNQLTVGPAKATDTFEDTGFASHIYSASENGPRGQGMLTLEQIVHATNGIWMCGAHENLIDKKNGVRFPVHTLQSWKALHEYRISYEHSGKQAAFGFVRQLALHQSPFFPPKTVIELAKTTFLIGANGSGKSALCDWLTVLDTSRNVNRWLDSSDLDWTITFDAPLEHQLRAHMTEGRLALELGASAVSRNYARSSTVYLAGGGDPKIVCDLKRIMGVFNLEEQAVRSVVARVSSPFVTKLEFVAREKDEEEDDLADADEAAAYQLMCHLGNGLNLSFGQISGGERGRIFLEIAMVLADEVAPFGPVLLLIEANNINMDWGALQPYIAYFGSADCLYQTIVTATYLPTDIKMLGWQIYTLSVDPEGKRAIAATLVG
jgi:hypothetical protein